MLAIFSESAQRAPPDQESGGAATAAAAAIKILSFAIASPHAESKTCYTL